VNASVRVGCTGAATTTGLATVRGLVAGFLVAGFFATGFAAVVPLAPVPSAGPVVLAVPTPVLPPDATAPSCPSFAA